MKRKEKRGDEILEGECVCEELEESKVNAHLTARNISRKFAHVSTHCSRAFLTPQTRKGV